MGDELGALYAALATGCGYAYRAIDAMTLAEAGEIFGYWEHSPPAHLMLQTIARLLGWAPRTERPPTDAAGLAATPPPGLAVSREGLGMPAAVLDVAALRQRNRARQAGRASG